MVINCFSGMFDQRRVQSLTSNWKISKILTVLHSTVLCWMTAITCAAVITITTKEGNFLKSWLEIFVLNTSSATWNIFSCQWWCSYCILVSWKMIVSSLLKFAIIRHNKTFVKYIKRYEKYKLKNTCQFHSASSSNWYKLLYFFFYTTIKIFILLSVLVILQIPSEQNTTKMY